MSVVEFEPSLILNLLFFILSIVFLRSAKPKFWKLLIYYFGFDFVSKIYFHVSLLIVWDWVNHFHNLFYVLNSLSTPVILYLFCNVFKEKLYKNIGKIFFLIFLLINSLNLFQTFQNHFPSIFTQLLVLKHAFIAILSLLAFYELIREERIKDILKEESFWFATGCLCYFTIPISHLESLPKYFNEGNSTSVMFFPPKVHFVLVNLMYLFWMIGFFFIRKKATKPDPSIQTPP